MSGLYFDTGVALKLVVNEPLSERTRQFVTERKAAVPISRLHEVEIQNSLQALTFRKLIDDQQLAAAQSVLADLFRSGRFRRIDVSIDRMAAEALSLASIVTRITGCRTLDLMHVAAAKLWGAREFVSTDARQIQAASLCGLRVVDFLA